jgi:hypothetical protein
MKNSRPGLQHQTHQSSSDHPEGFSFNGITEQLRALRKNPKFKGHRWGGKQLPPKK